MVGTQGLVDRTAASSALTLSGKNGDDNVMVMVAMMFMMVMMVLMM